MPQNMTNVDALLVLGELVGLEGKLTLYNTLQHYLLIL